MSENGDNLFPLHPSRVTLDGELPLPVEELAEVVGAIGRCLAEISSKAGSGASVGKTMATPLLLHMSTVEQWLGKLDEINVTTWPDARWALLFCNARVRANAMGFRYLGINARFPVLVTVGSSWSRACRRPACHAG